VVVVDATAREVGSAAEVAVGVAIRLLAFTGMVYLAAQLRRGRNWARIALAVLYGGFGTLSVVIGPITWLAEGGRRAGHRHVHRWLAWRCSLCAAATLTDDQWMHGTRQPRIQGPRYKR
jgi:hypothetical protein